MEERLELFYVDLGAESEPIHVEFWLNMRMNFLMNKTVVSTGWPFTKPVSPHPGHVVRQHFPASFAVRCVHVIEF